VQVLKWRDGIFLWASKCALRCDTELPYALMCDLCAGGDGFYFVAEVKHAEINLGFGRNCQFPREAGSILVLSIRAIGM
jgi:hypothetical protein